MMSMPDSLLDSTEKIANGFQKVQIQTLNQQAIVHKASEQINSSRSRQRT
jgi:hypothetical protein